MLPDTRPNNEKNGCSDFYSNSGITINAKKNDMIESELTRINPILIFKNRIFGFLNAEKNTEIHTNYILCSPFSLTCFMKYK